MTGKPRISVLGAGAWGTALAAMAASGGQAVQIWSRQAGVADQINQANENTRSLPDAKLPPTLSASTNLTEVAKAGEIVLLAVPAQTMSAMLDQLPPLPADTALISCAKGIDRQSGQRMSQIITEKRPGNPVGVLSGPSFAHDLVRHLPTAVTIAAPTPASADDLAAAISAPHFRCYASDDMVGTELGGALKNVLAIAVGMVAGLDLGASAQAALTTRGYAELKAIALALGAREATLYGLSGLGDLILSCASARSRNFAYGQAVATGADMTQMKLAEGSHTAAVAADVARAAKIDAPIIFSVDAILQGQSTVVDAMHALLSRPLRRE